MPHDIKDTFTNKTVRELDEVLIRGNTYTYTDNTLSNQQNYKIMNREGGRSKETLKLLVRKIRRKKGKKKHPLSLKLI